MFIAPRRDWRAGSAVRATMNEAMHGRAESLQEVVSALFSAFATDDRIGLNIFVAGTRTEFAQQQIAGIKIFCCRFDEQVGEIGAQERFGEHGGRDSDAYIKENVVKVMPAMFDESRQT